MSFNEVLLQFIIISGLETRKKIADMIRIRKSRQRADCCWPCPKENCISNLKNDTIKSMP